MTSRFHLAPDGSQSTEIWTGKLWLNIVLVFGLQTSLKSDADADVVRVGVKLVFDWLAGKH
jgi:hypothetical protein